jgi:arylsulfatase A-like enzyme
VAANHTTDIVTSHTDLAPTFFDLLGISQREDFDVTAIPVTRSDLDIESANQRRREHVNVEYWGFAGGEGIYGRMDGFPLHFLMFIFTDMKTDELHEHNTYKAIRIVGSGYNLYYSIWCNNEREINDMDV